MQEIAVVDELVHAELAPELSVLVLEARALPRPLHGSKLPASPWAVLFRMVQPSNVRGPLEMIAPPPGLPRAKPPCSVKFLSVNDAAKKTSKSRNGGVPGAALRSIVAPLPRMVRFPLPVAMAGNPVPGLTVLLAAVSVKVAPASSVIVSA